MPVLGLPVAMGEFAASRHGALSRSQAAAFGFNRRDIDQLIRQGILREAAPNVVTLADSTPTWRQALMVATLTCNEAGVIGYRPAATLAGVDCWTEPALELVLRSQRKIHIEGIRIHVSALDRRDITEIDFIRCTTLERTICDVASVASAFETKACFEWYWRTRGSLDELHATALRLHRPGQRGTKRVLALIDDAVRRRVPTGSTLEVQVEMAIDGIEGLVRQFEVFDDSGRFVARPDFAVPRARLAIEAHSKEWHSTPEQIRSDQQRDARLTESGWRVRYVTKPELLDPARVKADITRLILTGDRPPPYAPPPA